MQQLQKKPKPLNVTNIFIEFARNNPGTALVYFLTLLLVPLQDVGLPHLYGRVINAIQTKAPLMWPFLSVLFVIALLQMSIIIVEWNETYYAFPALQIQIRKSIIEHIFANYETDYDEQNTALIISKMIKLPNVFYNMIEQYKLVLIPQTIVCFFIVIYFLRQDVWLGIAVAIVFVIIVILVNISPKMCSKHSRRREELMNTMHEEIDDILRNMMSIYNTDTLGYEDEVLDELHQTYREESKETLNCVMQNKYILTPMIIALYSFFMYRCYLLVTQKRLNTGMFVSMFLIMVSLMGSLTRYVNQIRDLVARKGLLDASIDVIGTDIIHQADNTKPRPPPNKMPTDALIYFDDVTYSYKGSTTPIINHFTLSIPNGQHVLVKGRIGCGKSTLLRLLMKYKVPQKGEIYFTGKPYKSLSPKLVRSVIGYVPQVPVLFNRSIYDNITYGMDGISKKQVKEMLIEYGLQHIFDTFHEGIDANVGKNGSKLSGGQRQIVWILRVLLRNPMIVLMDEPTASIDDKTKDTVRQLLGQVMEKRTVIMVTHDDYLESFADRILEMKDGQIASDTLTALRHHSFY